MCRPAKLPPDNVLRPDRPAERVLGLKEGLLPASDSRIGLESSSTGSSFPLILPSPFPWLWFSLDSRRGHRIPLSVPVLSWLFGPGKLPKSCSQSVPGRHEAVRSHHVSRSSSPPTVGGFELGPRAQPSSQSFSRLRIHFADFPCLHCSIDQRLAAGMHRTPRDVRCSSSCWTLPPAEPFPGGQAVKQKR
ncbi:unnamed protein product [Brassica napus]|uniref:(rape) hypothetical protein n=1 Tax=Brassica napus TaxID=3708 RepID=A0A816SKS0_BRANA|nr:unnamed protein product [Brassica napus]